MINLTVIIKFHRNLLFLSVNYFENNKERKIYIITVKIKIWGKKRNLLKYFWII